MHNDTSVNQTSADPGNKDHLLRRIIRLIYPYKTTCVLVILLGCLSACFTLALSNFAKFFFVDNAFVIPGWPIIGSLILVVAIAGILSMFQSYFSQKIGENVVRDTRILLSTHLLQLPICEYDRRESGDLLSRVSSDTSRFRYIFQQGASTFSSGILLVLGSIVYMAILNPVLLLSALVIVFAVFSLVIVASKLVEKASITNQTDLGVLTSILNRDITGIRSIRASNATMGESQNVINHIEKVRKSGLSVAIIESIINPLSSLSLELAAVLIIGLGMWQVSTGFISGDNLAQFIILLFIMISPLSQIMYTLSQFGDAKAALIRIKGILDIPLEIETGQSVEQSSSSELVNEDGNSPAVAFHNVSFSYDADVQDSDEEGNRPRPVLRNISFSIHRNQTVGIVGLSGAGKSTVLQLIERFYEPTGGEIDIYGRQITRMTREELRAQLAYVEQDSPALSGTLRDNLTLGMSNISDRQCEDILHAVNLGDLLKRDARGLDLIVGEHGVTLSGGERQRLAIARALISPAQIILLDEATANLDAQNERKITSLLNQNHGNRTVVIVAHRLATVHKANCIYVLDHGKIIGSGTHEQLVATTPLYANLAAEQGVL